MNQDQRSACFQGDEICGNCKFWFESPYIDVPYCQNPGELWVNKEGFEKCHFDSSRFVPAHGSELGSSFEVKDLEEKEGK